jgi:hypothetical protein
MIAVVKRWNGYGKRPKTPAGSRTIERVEAGRDQSPQSGRPADDEPVQPGAADDKR